MKELKIHLTYYLEMFENETEEEAFERFHHIVDRDCCKGDEYESSMQVYDVSVQEF